MVATPDGEKIEKKKKNPRKEKKQKKKMSELKSQGQSSSRG